MAVTVGGTSITFNDGTTQSTAAGAVTTTAVLNATAGGAAYAVGVYASRFSMTDYTVASTYSGSSLGFSTGTWRCMSKQGNVLLIPGQSGYGPAQANFYMAHFLRIS